MWACKGAPLCPPHAPVGEAMISVRDTAPAIMACAMRVPIDGVSAFEAAAAGKDFGHDDVDRHRIDCELLLRGRAPAGKALREHCDSRDDDASDILKQAAAKKLLREQRQECGMAARGRGKSSLAQSGRRKSLDL